MFRSARKPLRYPSIHLIAPCETGGLGALGCRSWRLFIFEIKKIGEIMKVNGFNDVFRSGATSATECQAAKQSNALITIALSCFTSLFFFYFVLFFLLLKTKYNSTSTRRYIEIHGKALVSYLVVWL